MARQTELERQIRTADNTYKQNMTPDNIIVLTHLKYEFNTILTGKAEFALFRARQKRGTKWEYCWLDTVHKTEGGQEHHTSD